MHKLIRLTAVAALVAFSFAGPTAAAPPLHFEQVVPVTVVYEPCGAVETVTYTIRGTEFLDSEGNVRILLRIDFEGTITVPRTGETVAERGHQTLVVEADGTFEFAGVSFNVHVPGEGVILLEAGRLVLDADGNVVQQSAKTAVDLDAKVCAALG